MNRLHDKAYKTEMAGLLVVAIIFAVKIGIIYWAGTAEALRDTAPYWSIIVACFAAAAALNALKTTRESLELTRNSQRPFLSVVSWGPISLKNTIVPIRLHILNSGILPANNMSAKLDFFAENELVKSDNSSNVYEVPEEVWHSDTVVFPGGSVVSDSSLDQSDVKGKQIVDDILAHRKIKIRARIKYKSNIKGHIFDHETLVTSELRVSENNKYVFFSMPPQEWT